MNRIAKRRQAPSIQELRFLSVTFVNSSGKRDGAVIPKRANQRETF